jgi:hypothetical protein
VARAQLAHLLKIAGPGKHDAEVHHHGLHDESPDLAATLGQNRLQRVFVVEGNDQCVTRRVGRDAARVRHRPRSLGGSSRVHRRNHRIHHGIVMTVVRTFDFQQYVFARSRPSEPYGIHRRLGP